jgi:Legionella pneumophila major outer membrane protein precursor
MTPQRLVISIFLALCLPNPLLAGERITDDNFVRRTAISDEPGSVASPPTPTPQRAETPTPQPGLVEALVQVPWQSPQPAPTMMECAAGVCQECCPRGGWVGGIGVYIIKPHWTTNPAYATTISSGGVNVDSQTDFPYSFDAAPLVWLGYVGENGLGLRTRFWLFDQSSTRTLTNDGSATIISAAPLNYLNSSSTAGDVLTFTSGLDLDVIDCEITQTFEAGAFSGQLSAGGRYTRMEQTYVHREAPLTALDDTIDSSHAFDGLGPSIGAEVRRSLLDSGIALYANGRGSILFGRSSQQATNINNNVVANFGTYANWDVVPTWETELGILWQQDTDRGLLFLDAGVVGTAFFGAGNGANNQLILNSTDDQADKNATLGMFGFKFAAGMSY